MFRFKSLFYSLSVCFGIIFILSISSASVFAAEKPEIFVQLGHSDKITSIAFSPDGKYILSGSYDKTLKLWDLETGREIRTLNGHKEAVQSLSISPDGKYAVSGGFESNILIWDIEKGTVIKKIFIGKGKEQAGTHSVAFSPDGKYISAACCIDDRVFIKIYELRTGRAVKEFKGHKDWISSIAFSPDGKYIVSGSGWLRDDNSKDNTVRVWDIKKGSEIKRFSGHTKGIMSVAFSPDGRYVASGSYDKTVKLWDISKGNEPRIFRTANEVHTIAFSPDGKRLISSGQRVMELWDVSSGQVIATFKSDKSFGVVKFSPDGRYVAVSYSPAVAIWDISTVAHGAVYHESEYAAQRYGYSTGELKTFGGNVEGAKIVYFSSGGDKLKIAYYNKLFEYSLMTGASAVKTEIDEVYDIQSGGMRYIRMVEAKKQNPMDVIVDTRKDDEILRRPFKRDWPLIYTFSADGKFALVTNSQLDKLSVINTSEFKEISSLSPNPGSSFLSTFEFSPDGKHMVGAFTAYDDSDTLSIRLWDINTGKQIRTFSGHSHYITALAFTPDGKRLLSGSMDDTIKLWNVSTGQEIKTFKGHSGGKPIVISANGELALTGSSDNSLKLWDIASGKDIRTFKGHTNSVSSVSFSPDGKYVASASTDGTTRLWDISTGKELARFINFTDGEWIVITPEGYFNASPNGAKHLNVRVGNNVYGIDQFYAKFYRPELVQLALAGKEMPKGELITDIAAQKPAPNVQILSPVTNSSVDQDNVAVTLKITDSGGGIGIVNVYLNGAQVANDTRGVIVKGRESANERILSFTIPLIKGQNEIRAVAFNRENSMESNPALINVISNAVMRKPNLYALVIGINTYRNKSISLTYAVPDAIAFAGTLQKIASPLFEKADIRVLTTPEATTKEAITKAFEEVRQMVKPNDLFVFYDASHGMVDVVNGEEQYFLLTSNVRLLSSQHISEDALSHKDLVSLIGSIPAQKKLVILDTCNAGKGGKEIQIALLQQTRGLTDATAVKLLQRAVGSSVFSASADTQQALEGYKGHGLFTYVLMEGLQGKADFKKDGFITVKGLALHTEERVMTLSEEVFKRQQNPMIETGANDFPIGKVR